MLHTTSYNIVYFITDMNSKLLADNFLTLFLIFLFGRERSG